MMSLSNMLSREMWYAAESIREYVPNTLPDPFTLLAPIFSFFAQGTKRSIGYVSVLTSQLAAHLYLYYSD